MQSKVQLLNSNSVWNAKKRYKVDAVVSYNNVTYQNTTGANSEPGVGSDWLKLTPTLQQVTEAGATSNVGITIETDDVAIIGNSVNNVGVGGYSVNYVGVQGYSGNNVGVQGYSETSVGVGGYSEYSVATIFNIGASNINNISEFTKNNILQAYITHDGKAISKKVIVNTTVDNGVDVGQFNGSIKINGVINLKNYTVATLPTGRQGDTAYVTDALSPTYLGALTGGGTIKCPVFFNGTIWVSH